LRTPLVCALAATLVGCSCPSPPQAHMKPCTDTHGFACFDRTAAREPFEPNPASLKKPSDVKTTRPTVIAAKVEPPASRIPRRSLDSRLQPAYGAAADSYATRANIADKRPAGGAVANSNARTIQEQVAAATAVAERMTVTTLVPAPEPEANIKDRSNQLETVLRGDDEKTATAQLNKTDHLVAILMARPEIKSVSDLTGKIIAINNWQSASIGNVRTAIAAAGAAEVQLSNSQTKAVDRVISGEAPAAVLVLVSQEAAKGFPDIAGFKIFRIPLSPGSSKARP